MVAIGILTVAEVLRRGLDLLWITYRREVKQSTKVEEFRSLYGSSPLVIATVWADLITTEIDDARLDAANMTDKGFRSFMIAHYFCKVSRRPSLNESLTNIFAKMLVRPLVWPRILDRATEFGNGSVRLRPFCRQRSTGTIAWTIRPAQL
jgi:hypothetical protein